MAAVHPPQTSAEARASLCCERHDVGADVVRVSLSGDLDAGSVPGAERVLRAAHDDAAFIVVDLDRLASVDAAGAAVLRAAGRRARRHGRRVIAVNAQVQVHDALASAGVERALKLVVTPSVPRAAGPSARSLPS